MATTQQDLQIILIALACLHVTQNSGAAEREEDIPISLHEIRVILNYPVGELEVFDDSKEARQKSDGKIISAHRVVGDARSFAPLSIFVGKEQAFLTRELEARVEKYRERLEGSAIASSVIRRIELDESGHGIATSAFGPGGVIKRLVVTLPSIERDVELYLGIPLEAPLEGGREEWDEKEIDESLIKIVTKIYGNLMERELSEKTNGEVGYSQVNADNMTTEVKVENEPSSPQTRKTALEESAGGRGKHKDSKDKDSKGLIWMVVVGILTALVIWVRGVLKKS